MRLPWFSLEPVDESFFDSAPERLRASFDIARPAAEVWDEIAGRNPLHWCKVIDDITWTSPEPHGVDSTRTVKSLKGLNQLKERFFIWDDGRRKAFYVVESSGPLFRRFAEDYLVEPVSDSSCRFTWTIVYEPSTVGRPGNAINKRLLGSLFRDTRKYFGAS